MLIHIFQFIGAHIIYVNAHSDNFNSSHIKCTKLVVKNNITLLALMSAHLFLIHLKDWLNLASPTRGTSMSQLVRDYTSARSQSSDTHPGTKQNPCSAMFLPRKTWSPFGAGKITDFGIHPFTGCRRPSAVEGDRRMKRSSVIWDTRRIPH